MYKKVATDLNFVEREKKIKAFWDAEDIFRKSMEIRRDGPEYTFYDGPPTANGKPHIGHVLTRVIKDVVPRYHVMKGRHIIRKAGWDTHGLPVELEVEKLLGLDGKEQIEAYGMEPFIKKCKESVWQYKGMWEDFSKTVGFWADMDDPYVTYENDYIESEWWALKKIFDKGLLYKGFKIVPYCPRCGTPLSSHEVAQGYKDVKEKSVIVKFKATDEEHLYYLAWTTTPWTLPSNVALCVNPKETYIRVKQGDESYILAEALADTVLGGDYAIEATYTGRDLEYRDYEPLFDFVKTDKKGFYITCDDYVTLTDGTGIVHNAPAFGEDDAKVGKKYDLPFVQLVDDKGEFKAAATPYAGMFCKDADPKIMNDLAAAGLLFRALDFEHSYPHCWRCNTPLIYYARDSWFIKMTAVRDHLVANNDTVNWIPDSIGQGRFGDWIRNVQDWGISRDRYWGTPLNIWTCSCGKRHAVGSIEELKALSGNCPDDIELHRPYIDAVTFPCPDCGKEMHRTPEVIDAWFDSGSMPFAQWHYPFENKEIFEKHFPADFISEAVDQTRGWFYSLLAISTLIFDDISYKNVIVLGHVLDEHGQKMSKSKGNAVDPFEALERHGADAIRWYFLSNSALYLPSRFYDKAVSEYQRKFMGTLWNTYAFFVLYAEIDQFDPTQYRLAYDKLGMMDRWLLSRLHTVIRTVDANFSAYKLVESTRVLQEFVDDLSNWYVRRSRERFWAKGMEQDKINAYMTLYTTLTEFCKLCAPMVPFITDEIYQNLVRNPNPTAPISIHLCDYPVANPAWIDESLEAGMQQVLKLVVLGRACRNAANIKNRQPIGKMYVKSDGALDDLYADIVKEELNVKEVVITDDVRAYTAYVLKPNLKTVGPKYGRLLNGIRSYLQGVDGNVAYDELQEKGQLTFTVDGQTVALGRDDLLIEVAQLPGFISESDGAYGVVLETTLTEALIREGFFRELVSKIQTMRKEANFEVTDHIRVTYRGNERIAEIFRAFERELSDEVLADSVREGDGAGIEKEWDINKETVTIGIERVPV
ncbi:MAG: isoleucine--tRNA ligase [Eubacteriales bacterium]|nr:isoleucine--tRNA ligase [Eubacteriales bacterium]